MAAPVITVYPNAWNYSPYEPIIYEVTWDQTTNVSYTNIRMKAAIYVGTANDLYGVITKESISLSGTDTFRFNVADILKTKLDYEFYNNISTDQINSTTDQKVSSDYIVYFTAHYTESGEEKTLSSVTVSGKWIANLIIPRSTTTRYVGENEQLMLGINSTKKFLTHSPNNKVIRAGEDEQLSFLYGGALQLEYNYQTYDLGGTANAAQTKSLQTINSRAGHLTISDNGANTVIDDFANISKIDVWIEESDGTQISEKKTYLIDQKCPEGYRLWWGNSLGGFDKYTFNAYRNKTYKADKRINYIKPNDSTPTIEERKGSTLKVTGNYHFEGSSDFVSSDYMDFFVDLINSPNVYYQPYINGAYTTEIHPVVINSKIQAVEDSEDLIQVNVQFEYSEKQITMQG